MITLRFEIVDSELDLKFFKKLLVTEEQFELSRFPLVETFAEDITNHVIGEWRRKKRGPPPSAVDKS